MQTPIALLISNFESTENAFKSEDEKSTLFKHNFRLLMQKKSGDRFYASQGKIYEYGGMARWWYLICRLFCGMAVNASLKEVVTDTLSGLTPERVKQILLRGGPVTDEKIQACFAEIFFEKMPKMGNLFDRDRSISHDLETYLLEILRSENDKRDRPLTEYEQKIESVRLALKLGLDFTLYPEGSSGVYLGSNIRGKKICKFKPHDEGPYGPNVPRLMKRIQRLVRGFLAKCSGYFKYSLRPSLRPNQEFMAETWASIANDHCKEIDPAFNVVPETHLETFTSQAFCGSDKTRIGSCQLWVEGRVTKAIDYFSLNETTKRAIEEEELKLNKQDLEWLAVLTFVSGDQDKAFDNWSIVTHKGKVWASSYDNGLAFPSCQPTEWIATRKQHLWTSMAFAKLNFSKETTKLITRLFETRQVLIEKLKAYQAHAGTTLHAFSKEQAEALLERIDVLYLLAKYKLPINTLASVKTPDQFKNFLANYSSPRHLDDRSEMQ